MTVESPLANPAAPDPEGTIKSPPLEGIKAPRMRPKAVNTPLPAAVGIPVTREPDEHHKSRSMGGPTESDPPQRLAQFNRNRWSVRVRHEGSTPSVQCRTEVRPESSNHLKALFIHPEIGSWEGLLTSASLLAVVATAKGLEHRIGGKTSQPLAVIKAEIYRPHISASLLTPNPFIAHNFQVDEPALLIHPLECQPSHSRIDLISFYTFIQFTDENTPITVSRNPRDALFRTHAR